MIFHTEGKETFQFADPKVRIYQEVVEKNILDFILIYIEIREEIPYI